jgi:hypothetical protein
LPVLLTQSKTLNTILLILNKDSGDTMAINFTDVLLLTTDLILIIIVVYLADRLRKLKKNAVPAEEKQSPAAIPQEVKPDIPAIKTDEPEKAELKPGNEQIATVSPASSEPAPKKDELEDRLLEELHAIPSEVKPQIGALEPGTLKLEDEPPGENQTGMEPGTKPGKVRKSRKKRSISKKAASTGGAEQTQNGESKAMPGKKAGRKKKAAEPAVQIAEAKPVQEAVKEEKAEVSVKEEKPEVFVKEEKPEVSKEPQKDMLF